MRHRKLRSTLRNTENRQILAGDLILQYLVAPTLPNGRRIAERLEQNTDRRSGIGLLFLITGAEGREKKIVLSRFPADTANIGGGECSRSQRRVSGTSIHEERHVV